MLFSLHTSQKIFLIKDPRFENVSEGHMMKSNAGLHCTVTPVLPKQTSVFERKEILLQMIKNIIVEEDIWSYNISTDTCRAVPYIRELSADHIDYFQNDLESIIFPELFIEMNEYADAEEPELLYHPSLVPQFGRQATENHARE